MTDESFGYDPNELSFERQDDYRAEHDLPPQPETLSQLIEILELIEAEHGDLYLSYRPSGAPTPEVRNGEVRL